jgi:hypothetical protein
MAKTFPGIDDKLAGFLADQPVFFVATAPTGADGHINLSPKGQRGTFRILDPKTVAYLDFVGSGIETVAHLRDNGRIVIMFCAFSGPPRIVRLHGRGEAVLPDDIGFSDLAGCFPPLPGVRSVVKVSLDRVSDSCGFGVPLMTYDADRSQMAEWALRKGEEGLVAYQAQKNAISIDGLPGLAD